MSGIEILFLGTGGIMPTKERNVPAIALRHGGEILLFDVGEGTIRQMNTAKLSPMKVSKIFITHFHGDHYLGLAALVQTMNLFDRKNPLHIYGPKRAFEFIGNLLKSGFFKPGFSIHVHELGRARLKFKGYEVWSFEVSHGIPALGYVFKEADRRGRFLLDRLEKLGIKPGPILGELERKGIIEVNGRRISLEEVTEPKRMGVKFVYTGDTEPTETTVLFARNATVLVHDATYLNPKHKGESYHSTVLEACEIARTAGVNLLVPFHRAFRYDYKTYERTCRELCNVDLFVANDFDVIKCRGNRCELP